MFAGCYAGPNHADRAIATGRDRAIGGINTQREGLEIGFFWGNPISSLDQGLKVSMCFDAQREGSEIRFFEKI
jgi:hypothetical protein